MSVSILVATPHAAFGELLRLSLEESSQYQVRLVMTAKEALASTTRANFDIALLDSDIAEDTFVPLYTELIQQQPQMRFVVIPPDNNPNHPALGGIMPHAYLNRPFYLPDLLETINNLSTYTPDPQPPAVEEAPSWAGDLNNLQNCLEQEIAHTDAVALLVGEKNHLVARAGQLSDESANEMASILLRYWDPKEKTDLMRYVRSASDKGDYLAYATEITHDLVLMMVFNPGAQLSLVRPQSKQIAANLIKKIDQVAVPIIANGLRMAETERPSATPYDDNPLAENVYHHASSIIEPETERLDDEGLFSIDGKNFASPPTVFAKAEDAGLLNESDLHFGEEDVDDDSPAVREIDLRLLLGTIPTPDPDKTADTSAAQESGQPVFDWQHARSGWYSAADKGTSPFPPTNTSPSTMALPSVDEDLKTIEEDDSATRPVLRKPPETNAIDSPSARPFLVNQEPEIDPLSDTRPHVVATLTNIHQMEPASPALSLLNYTCVLLPRLPQHHLTGDLADQLTQWVQHLCLAFGWRLEGISLRPEYLQWTVQVAPSVSPGNLVRIIRQRTSLHIFNSFEYVKQQNPSGDFWATGYLIVSGPQPPSAQLLREYIAQTRKRQGIPKLSG